MKKSLLIILSIGVLGTASASDYNSDKFQKDLDVLVPLASKLKGKCLAEKDETACKKSDAIVSALRAIA